MAIEERKPRIVTALPAISSGVLGAGGGFLPCGGTGVRRTRATIAPPVATAARTPMPRKIHVSVWSSSSPETALPTPSSGLVPGGC
jgi:hypothetical protein